MITIEHNTGYIQSVNNIRLMQRLRTTGHQKTFAEFLRDEMREIDGKADSKRNNGNKRI